MSRTHTAPECRGAFVVAVWALRGLLAALAVAIGCAPLAGETVTLRSQPKDVLRGGRVGWARLQTPDPYWRRHAETDSRLSNFIRTRTSLNIDTTWYTAKCEDLADLCTYPFLFANSLEGLQTPASRKNLAEYLGRGGFLVVDACINRDINPDPDVFLRANIAAFQELLPGCEVRELEESHAIYSCFFVLQEKPPHTFHEARFDKRWARHGLKGVYLENRLVSVITLSGLQCGWAGVPAKTRLHGELCMETMLNIYVYAMTQ